MRRSVSIFVSLLACALVVGSCNASDPNGIHSVVVTPTFQSLAVGEKTRLTARALNRHGDVIEGTVFTWTDGDVARIVGDDGSVSVEAMSVGQQTIVATAEGVTGNAVLTVASPTDVRVVGRVIDGATATGLGDALIVYGAPGGAELGRVASADDGSFSFRIPPAAGPTQTLDLTVTRTGYVGTQLRGAVIASPMTQLETIQLVKESRDPGSIEGFVRNAQTEAPIASATLTLAEGQLDATASAPTIATTTSGANGSYAFTHLEPGTYTLFANAPGYREGRRTVITVPPGTDVTEDLVLSPDTLDVRVVLTWGETPADLDLHATGPNGDGTRFLVFGYEHGDANALPYTSLDIDSRAGFGPETITVARMNTGGVYRFAVHDFTNQFLVGSPALGLSGAKIEVYSRAGVSRFYVPNAPGNVWTVFELDGDIANPTITPVNAMSDQLDPSLIP